MSSNIASFLILIFFFFTCSYNKKISLFFSIYLLKENTPPPANVTHPIVVRTWPKVLTISPANDEVIKFCLTQRNKEGKKSSIILKHFLYHTFHTYGMDILIIRDKILTFYLNVFFSSTYSSIQYQRYITAIHLTTRCLRRSTFCFIFRRCSHEKWMKPNFVFAS